MSRLFIFIGLFIITVYLSVNAQKNTYQTFHLQEIRLLNGPFKHAQDLDYQYILQLNPDRLLSPFLTDAGLVPKAPKYGNWESSGLDGHTLGHYLSALALMYASTGSEEMLNKLNYVIDELARCQEKNGNGYVGGIPDSKGLWDDLSKGNLEVTGFSVNKRWVPWYNLHKTFAGLRDAYLYAGNLKAKTILIKLSDWCIKVTSSLNETQMQKMLQCEQGGMNEVLADVADITGENKYLQLAKRFSHKAILEPLLQNLDKLNGLHANTQIPKVIGFEKIGKLTEDTTWTNAARFFWETVVDHRTVSIGGNSVREHFHPSNDFSSMLEAREGPETCNTYNMLKLSELLYQSLGNLKYIDYYERALYNHILSSQHPVHGGFVYFTPMRPMHYRVYSQPQSCFWCCVGSGMENHAKYGEMIYAHKENDLFINLFIASTLNWKEKGLIVSQKTLFPEKEYTTIKLEKCHSSGFSIHIRYPLWVKQGGFKIKINGKNININEVPGNYISINRKWKKGDSINIELPMENFIEYIPDHKPWVSFLHGPIVLAAKTDTSKMIGLIANDSRMGHIANGPLMSIEDAPMIVSADTNFVSFLKPVAGQSSAFNLNSVLVPEKYRNLELIPFYKVHDSRYVIYWQYTTPQKYEQIKQINKEKEEMKLALEASTIDQIAPGEQQPESDHNFKSDRTESGIFKNRHWRHASGWFEYQLKDNNKSASILQITYYGLDKNRQFNIYLNDKLLVTEKLDGSKGDNFFTVDYQIPQDIKNTVQNNIYNLKFEALPGSIAGGIYYIRLLKKKQ